MKTVLLSLLSFMLFAKDEIIIKRNQEFNDALEKKYMLIPHKGTFILPVLYTENPNNEVYKTFEEDLERSENRGNFNKDVEAEIQFSFLILTNKNVFGSKFSTFVGYTQQSWWQMYNDKWSRPFRETNYEPEFFIRKILEKPMQLIEGIDFDSYDLGIVHQSNGQVQELSRSWNRVFLRLGFNWFDLTGQISLWHRINENSDEDDNPDIYKYMGYGELKFTYTSDKLQTSLRIIPGIEKQGYELDFSLPWKEGLRFYTKLSHGYGLSLIDYNYFNNKIGVGFILSNFLVQAKQN